MFSTLSIPQLINFCLDINCNINDDGILPKNVCTSCLEKLQIAFELKTHGKESDKYLMEILKSAKVHDIAMPEQSHYYAADDHDDLLELLNVSPEGNNTEGHKGAKSAGYVCADCGKSFRYVKPYKKHLKLHKHDDNPDDDHSSVQGSAVSSDKPDDNIEDSDDSECSPKGGRTGNHVCGICCKTFKYQKPYKNHMKLHNAAKNLNKNRTVVSKPIKALLTQAPYDSKSPYGSPAPLDGLSDNEPDFGLMMVSSTFLNGGSGEPSNKRLRKQKQIFSSRSESLEANPEISILGEQSKRGRGRPRKIQRIEPEEEQDSSDEKEHPDLADFSEVDVKRMLKTKPISFVDDSVSQSVPTTSSRSRSPSVEVIQEFDIFGSSVLADRSPKIGFVSRKSLLCEVNGCSKKFHLKANLKKHHREAHGMK